MDTQVPTHRNMLSYTSTVVSFVASTVIQWFAPAWSLLTNGGSVTGKDSDCLKKENEDPLFQGIAYDAFGLLHQYTVCLSFSIWPFTRLTSTLVSFTSPSFCPHSLRCLFVFLLFSCMTCRRFTHVRGAVGMEHLVITQSSHNVALTMWYCWPSGFGGSLYNRLFVECT